MGFCILEISAEIDPAISLRISLEILTMILLGILLGISLKISIGIPSGVPGGIIQDNFPGILSEVPTVILPGIPLEMLFRDSFRNFSWHSSRNWLL